jgi:large subunit ribosomal protein L29
MPNTAAQELRDLNDGELFERLAQAKEELFNLRFQHVTGQLENHSRLQHLKKHIARCNTELRAREIAAAEALTSTAEALTEENE